MGSCAVKFILSLNSDMEMSITLAALLLMVVGTLIMG